MRNVGGIPGEAHRGDHFCSGVIFSAVFSGSRHAVSRIDIRKNRDGTGVQRRISCGRKGERARSHRLRRDAPAAKSRRRGSRSIGECHGMACTHIGGKSVLEGFDGRALAQPVAPENLRHRLDIFFVDVLMPV